MCCECAALLWKAKGATAECVTGSPDGWHTGTAGVYLVSRVALNYGTSEAIFSYEAILKEVIAS